MDDRQHHLKRTILALRILVAVVAVSVGIFLSVVKTVYPHNHYQGPIAIVAVAIVLGVAVPISRRISRIKAELASLP